jgi:hypothetical protein
MSSCGMWRSVGLVGTDVSEGSAASIFRVKNQRVRDSVSSWLADYTTSMKQ